MKFRLVGIVLLILATSPLPFAESASSEKSKTELETFAAQTGAVIIKGYSEIGEVKEMGPVDVDCREFTNAQTGEKSYGMVIKITESGRLERDDSSFIDLDEIPSLITGIDYIAKIKPDVTKLHNFEATYSTRGDFSVTVFSDSRGKLAIAVSSGRIGRATAYLSLEQLAQLRALVVGTQEKIESIK